MAGAGMVGAPFWRARADGMSVSVKVTPRARKPGLGGVAADGEGSRLAVGVREAAEDGRANRAACAALAGALDVPPSSVSVAQGATSRRKTLHVAGDPGVLEARLEALRAGLDPVGDPVGA